MTLVLDAMAHPPEDRSDLVHEAIAASGARRRVALNAPAGSVDLRAETWQIGTIRVLRTAGTGLTLSRTERDVRIDSPEMVAVALSTGPSRCQARGVSHELDRNGVILVDFATPYSFSHVGSEGNSFTAHIPYRDLGVSRDVVRSAIPALSSSPLLALLRGHLLQLSESIDTVSDSPAVAADVGAATVDLTRALVTAAAGAREARDVAHETLRAQVVAYIHTHLRDPELTPSRIAAEHYISLRSLYNLWGNEEGSLVDWIIRSRLERVRRDLAAGAATTNIFSVARSWGFTHPSHFSRRFRATYGDSPRDWMRISAATASPGRTDGVVPGHR